MSELLFPFARVDISRLALAININGISYHEYRTVESEVIKHL